MNKIWMKGDIFAKRLTNEESSNLTDAELKQYEEDLNNHLQATEKLLQDKIKALEGDAGKNKDEIAELRSTLKDLNIQNLQVVIEKQGVQLSQMIEKGAGVSVSKSVKAQVLNFVTENADKIKTLKTQGHGFIEFISKAPEDITTVSASNPDGIPELMGVQSAPPTNVNLRGSIVDTLVNSFPTNQASFPYTESLPKDGDYAFVGEGELKPQIDFEIETRYAEPKKVAAHEILTDESVKDIPNLKSIATNYLRAKHDLKRQQGILFGDGIGTNLKGATVYGRLFNAAGPLAGTVETPNFMDVVNAGITDVYTTHNYQDEMPYIVNLVLVNPIDFFVQLVSAKDGNGLPLYPTASLFNRVIIGGATIVPFEDIPVGKIFISDMSKYNVSDYVGYTIKIGWINDQLITNKFTMVGESRLHGFVKKLDEQAFLYDDIQTIKDAITKV